jgi:hypothetical protein
VDEVVTKSQESGHKTNKTFIATIEADSGRTEILCCEKQHHLHDNDWLLFLPC